MLTPPTPALHPIVCSTVEEGDVSYLVCFFTGKISQKPHSHTALILKES